MWVCMQDVYLACKLYFIALAIQILNITIFTLFHKKNQRKIYLISMSLHQLLLNKHCPQVNKKA